MFVRGDISILIPDLFRCVVAILTAPAVGHAINLQSINAADSISEVISTHVHTL
jgi:hypothetical protein